MASDPQVPQSEIIEQRTAELELVAQLSPSKETQAHARARAERLRKLLERIKVHNAEDQALSVISPGMVMSARPRPLHER